MSNTEMKPGRFLRFARCRAIVARIQNHLRAGGTVVIGTQTRATRFSPKHCEMFRATKGGAYFRSGKNWVCFDEGLEYRMVGIAFSN